MLCYVMLVYAMLGYVMLSYIRLCKDVLGCVKLGYVIRLIRLYEEL
jgi:hypothetical protein